MKLLATAAAALLGASAASAATVTFTAPTSAPIVGVTTGDVAVGYAVTASAYDTFGLNPIPATVTQTAAGLGVSSAPYGFPDGTPNQIDGRPVTTGEAITVSFGYAVDLDAFTLGGFDGNDDYTLYINGVPVAFGTTATGGGYQGVTSFTIQANGTLFQDGPFLAGNDEFTLASFSVSAVPLPAAAGLLGGALALLGLARRRKAA